MPIIGSESPSEEISLYFHIPFCSKKCPYCHFYVIPNRALHREIYLKALFREWQLRLPYLKDKIVRTIYFGGGTPSLFPEALESVQKWIQDAKISLSENVECSFEMNPEDVTSPLLQRMKDAGVNRVSMGVQSLSDTALETLGRSHGRVKALNSLELIDQAGIQNVSIDLMYDLPKESVDSFEETLRNIEKLPITHLSLYNLTLEPHTVFFKKRKELAPLLPKPEDSLSMLQAAVEMLESYGLKRYEISAFAKNGLYSRHNTGYWTGRPFLGFGPSAFSYWERKRFRNSANLLRYAKMLEEGKEPVDFSECLSSEDQQKELMCVQLRLLEGVDLVFFQKKHGTLSSSLKKSLQELTQQGLLNQKEETVALSKKGLLFHDSVAEALI